MPPYGLRSLRAPLAPQSGSRWHGCDDLCSAPCQAELARPYQATERCWGVLTRQRKRKWQTARKLALTT
eukprot:404552-Alexandrium_andersonii.AAC.1